MEIVFVLYEGFTALDVVGPYEVLSRLPGAKTVFASLETGTIVTDTGCLSMLAERRLDQVPQPDIFLLPGGLAGTLSACRNPELIAWVKQAHEKSRYTTSVCTGSLILAAAGLLKGKRATTHWMAETHLERFGAIYDAKRWVQSDRCITAAGVSAGIDMALWLAEEIAGAHVAQTLQLSLEYDPQPPYDMGHPSKAAPEIFATAQKVLNQQLSQSE